jgi:hypothetical protein
LIRAPSRAESVLEPAQIAADKITETANRDVVAMKKDLQRGLKSVVMQSRILPERTA